MLLILKLLKESIIQLFVSCEDITTYTSELFNCMEETSIPVTLTCKTNLELLIQSSHIFRTEQLHTHQIF